VQVMDERTGVHSKANQPAFARIEIRLDIPRQQSRSTCAGGSQAGENGVLRLHQS
jgi:hypothetical protein